MANFLYKTKGNTDPKGKPRVYFTCHPADFERYFEKILADIFKTHDCAVYYTEDMAQPMDEAELEVGLGQMNLFVVPVTFRLLSQPNRAMDEDIAYAKQENIPILPFMMEQGIDNLYSKPDKFGLRQYLNPYSADLTEISYENKLKQYLESVLISDEMAKRIRAAFDAYIFLSYRKKDRKYANELMKLIHKNPELRDIAIWYDEFLTPGESFVDSIQKALEDSKMFALLVTPNLLEEPDGQPNFVMAKEYPAAVKAEKLIMPAEMVSTDHGALAAKFPSIPDCADPQDDTAFKERLLQSLQKLAITANDRDPEHNFLIGLAYLEGIDVEVNRERGIELITSAADAGLLEAMEKLYTFYKKTAVLYADYEKVLKFAQKIHEKVVGQNGSSHPESINALLNLAESYADTWLREGHVERAVKLYHEAYELIRRVYEQEDHRLIEILLKLADICDRGIVNTETLKYLEQAHALQCKIWGEEDPVAITTLRKIADFYTHEELFANDIKAVELWEKVHALQCKVYGADAEITRKSEKQLATLRERMNSGQKRVIACKKKFCEVHESLGESHPQTLDALSELASAYENLSDYEKAVRLRLQVYTLRSKALGETHQDTVTAKRNLAHAYASCEDYEKALQFYEQILSQQCRTLGKNTPQIAEYLKELCKCYVQSGNLDRMESVLKDFFFDLDTKAADTDNFMLEMVQVLPGLYAMQRQFDKAICWGERVYGLYCIVRGEYAMETIMFLRNLGTWYSFAGNWNLSSEALQKAYTQMCWQMGPTHPMSVGILNSSIALYIEHEQYQKAIAMLEQAYDGFCKAYDPEDKAAVELLWQVAECRVKAGEYQKAGEQFIAVWKTQCRRLGKQHEETQRTLDSIKNCIEKMVGEPGYETLYEKYLALQEERSEEDDIHAWLEQAFQAEQDGNYGKAAMFLEDLYDYSLAQGGGDKLTRIPMLQQIANWYEKAEQEKKAVKSYQRIYDLRCKCQGQEHEDALAALHELATANLRAYNRTAAKKLYEEAYISRCRVLGEEHADTLSTAHQLADTYRRISERKKSLEMFERVYASRCRVLGMEHPDTLRTLYRMADAYSSEGFTQKSSGNLEEGQWNIKKATELYKQAYASMRQVLGEVHGETLLAMHGLRYNYTILGEYAKAIELCEQEFKVMLENLGEQHEETPVVLFNQAAIYKEMGDYQNAARVYEQEYALHLKVRGEEHTKTQDALHYLAEAYSQLGQHQKAAQLYKQQYIVYSRTRGEDYWETECARQNMEQETAKA